jgi:hypothetical protein
MAQLVVDFHLSSVIFTNNTTETSYSRIGSICEPPRRKGRLKSPRNYNEMRRMRRVAEQAKANKIGKHICFGMLFLQNGINPDPTFR